MWLVLLTYGSAPFTLGAYIGWAFARGRWVGVATTLVIVLALGAVLLARVAHSPAGLFDGSDGGDMGDISPWDILVPFVVTPCLGFLFGIDVGIGVTRLVRRAREPHLR